MATIFGGWSSRFPREGEEKLFEQRIQINLETIPILFRVREKDELCLSEFREIQKRRTRGGGEE